MIRSTSTSKNLLSVALAIVFLLFGINKWYVYQAEGVYWFLSNSPLFGWIYSLFSHEQVARGLGIIEISTGILLLCGLLSRRVALLAAALSCGTYAVTVSIMFTLPGLWQADAGGFPAMSSTMGFLFKDVVLLASSGILLTSAWQAVFGRWGAVEPKINVSQN